MRNLLIAVAVVAFLWMVVIAVLWVLGRKVAAKQLARAIPDLVALCRGLMGDPQVPFGSKVLVGAALAWVLSPIDLVPEFIPVLGPLDDLIVVGLVLRHLLKRAGPDVVQAHWRGDPRLLRTALRLAGLRLPGTPPGVRGVLERVGETEQLGSCQARAMKEIPIGKPPANPAGTVMCG